MKLILPLFAVSATVSLVVDNLVVKTVAFFAQGFLHIKISTSFQHLFELIPESSKLTAGTVITAFD